MLDELMSYYEDEMNKKISSSIFDDVVLSSYLEKHPMTCKAIKLEVSDIDLKNVLEVYIEREIRKHKGKKDIISCCKVSFWENLKSRFATSEIRNVLEENFYGVLKSIQNVKAKHYRNIIYLLYYFSNYQAKRASIYNEDLRKIKKLDNGKYGEQIQFRKYELITLTDKMQLFALENSACIYDANIDKSILVSYLPACLCSLFNQMIAVKEIKTISFRLADSCIFPGKRNLSLITEEVARGRCFSNEKFKDACVTELYTSDYKNALWIKVDGANITFEEIVDDFDSHGDYVVTQVIHLEYYKENKKVFIKHIDHEFIFYTYEEFDTRCSYSNTKGVHKKRMKTFKIDGSSIDCMKKIDMPFGNSMLVLHFILLNYFKNHDLLEEYFDGVPE